MHPPLIDPASLLPGGVRPRTYAPGGDHLADRSRARDRGVAGARRRWRWEPGTWPGGARREGAVAALAGDEAPAPEALTAIRAAVSEGLDPLGEAFCRLRDAERRRPDGATYTPPAIVESMVAWAALEAHPGADRRSRGGIGAVRRRGRAAFSRRADRGGGERSRRGDHLPRPPGDRRPRRPRGGAGRRLPHGRSRVRRTAARCTSATRPTCATTRSRPGGRSGSP